MILYCVTSSTSPQPITYYEETAEYECTNGIWIVVDENGNYFNPDSLSEKKPVMYYNEPSGTCSVEPTLCEYTYTPGTWSWASGCSTISGYPTNNELLIKYDMGD